MWKLFIDDERSPVTDDWVIARSTSEAIMACVVRNSFPNEIAFDHDLGGQDTSIKFIWWMIDECIVQEGFQIPEGFKYSIHSQNPIGASNIKCLMTNFLNEVQ